VECSKQIVNEGDLKEVPHLHSHRQDMPNLCNEEGRTPLMDQRGTYF